MLGHKKIILGIVCGLFFLGGAVAQTSMDEWNKLEPPEDSEWDWIQLTSGEWLKGDFKVLYDYVIEFDSDELDLLEFDLEDVQQLRTRNPQVLRIESKWGSKEESEIRGRLLIDGGDVSIRNGEIEQHFKRSQIVAIADGVEHERDYWSGSISLGITARGGNTETTDSTTMINLKRRRASSRFVADYLGNYSVAGTNETANNHRLIGTYDWFIAPQFFWQLLGVQYYKDPFSNIENQYSVATAVGYDLIRGSKTEWELLCGAGYQFQEFVSVLPPEDDKVDTPFFLMGTRYDTELSKSVDFLFDYHFRVLNEISGTYTHHALAKISTEFIGDFDLDVSLIWDHIQTPQAKDDGTLPEKDDYQIVLSLAYDF